MKPPFSYYGGKQKIAAKIVRLLPPHAVYLEPFCGSAAVMFEKGIPPVGTTQYREIISDKNELLIGFFRVLQDRQLNEELMHRLSYTLYSRAEYKRALELCKVPVKDPVLMAWAWFVNINMSFARKLGGGWGIATAMNNQAHRFRLERERVASYSGRLQGVHIDSGDALSVIKRWDSPQTCHYCDSPYPGTDQGHFGGYTQADFEALIATLKACQGSVVLSCYDNPAVPSEWEKHEFETYAWANGVSGKDHEHDEAEGAYDDARRTECVWIKPSATIRRPELQKSTSLSQAFFRGQIPEQLRLFGSKFDAV